METVQKQKGASLARCLVVVVACCCIASMTLSLCAWQETRSWTNALHEQNQTREDDVNVAEVFRILSTMEISDAYHAGKIDALSKTDKATLDMALDVLRKVTNETMTPFEKEKAVYDWMCQNISRDEGNAGLAIPNADEGVDRPYSVLTGHKAVCVGYATTFRLFMQLSNIECMVVHDTERQHAWNLVNLDGDWYHVDVFEDATTGNYKNFNLTDNMRAGSYVDWDKDFFPAANGTKYNYTTEIAIPIEDIYKIPADVKNGIDRQLSMLAYRFSEGNETDHAIIEGMLSEIYKRVSGGKRSMKKYYDDEDEYVEPISWQWLEPTDSASVLAIYLNVRPQQNEETTLDAEQLHRIQTAVDAVFGKEEKNDGYESEAA